MANARRGEVAVSLGGRRMTLCLTLGALAEIETAFGVDGLAGLGARFETGRLSARDLVSVLGAAARGGGERTTDEEIAALPVAGGLDAYARAVAALFTATFGEPGGQEGSAHPFEAAGG